MAMKLDSKKPIVTINMTPLVDVSLVLVVIFMATAPMFLQSGIIVTSGEKKAVEVQPQAAPKDNIVIKLEGEAVLLNQQPVTLEDLPGLLRSMLRNSEQRRVIVNPDREILHGQVVKIMDIAKQAGADNLVILGKSQPEAAPAALPIETKPR
ncbi:MAG: biopolymer transporter ExbD [Candidatus Firestonebacteria bacterium]|nr:biopolymer transporter ExbD [Candidatus Firestonebacteria bacterium]